MFEDRGTCLEWHVWGGESGSGTDGSLFDVGLGYRVIIILYTVTCHTSLDAIIKVPHVIPIRHNSVTSVSLSCGACAFRGS